MIFVRFICTACSRMAWECRLPVGVRPDGYAPKKCGWCGSTTFVERKAA